MSILGKIQNLPEGKRKIILWSVVVVLGLFLFIFFIKNTQKNFKNLKLENIKEELGLPSLKEELGSIPKFEMPNIEMPNMGDFATDTGEGFATGTEDGGFNLDELNLGEDELKELEKAINEETQTQGSGTEATGTSQ